MNIYKFLEELIYQTIEITKAESRVTRKISKKLGREFVNLHFLQLKNELLKEIRVDQRIRLNNYVSIDNFFNDKYLSNDTSRGWVICNKFAINILMGKNNLVNLIFPCRNSAKNINASLSFLISEILKTHSTDFNVVFQINNNSDDTIVKISEILDLYKKILKNCNFFILETPRNKVISLPGSLNEGYFFLNSEALNFSKKYKQIFFSFWDDELLDLIPRPDSLFNSNISALLSSKTNRAISGYMIDNRISVSRWHDLSKGFSADIRFLHAKPYLHGGAGTVVRWKDYPQKGIEHGGIADTDLSAHLLSRVGLSTLKKLSHENWPVRSNPNSPVFHPIEENVLKWTVKYLMYQSSWEKTFKTLHEKDNQISKLWIKRIKENREAFHRKIDQYIENLSPQKVLDREFMHSYYKTIVKLNNKSMLYYEFRKYRDRSY
ncbi:MAG: hypothetical protein Q8P26_01295 [Candidatus Levybacteria bacterium]|nr:hypothetical protein [Candidatus Levybacteria bacterium]